MNKLIFGDTEVSKKQFYKSKKGIKLKDVDVSKIVVSDKVKGDNEIVKYFIGYMSDTNVVPLCGWIKYFKNGEKNMSFKIEDDEVYLKCNEIWNKIKELLNGVKLDSDVIYDGQYIKTKVKRFSEITKTMFDRDKIPKERVEYTCIPCTSIDSVLKIDRKHYPQVYLEQCKYKVKKREIKSLIDYEIDLSSDYESD